MHKYKETVENHARSTLLILSFFVEMKYE